MARGWESKSVEMQREEGDMFRAPEVPAAPPSDAQREIALLEMSRKRLEREIMMATSRRFRAQKQLALDHVERALKVALSAAV